MAEVKSLDNAADESLTSLKEKPVVSGEDQGGVPAKIEIPKSNLPANIEDMLEEDQGAGHEGIGTKDLAIPFFGIIQTLSPQRKKDKAEYIPGAEEGMIFNTVTKQLYPSAVGINFIPVVYQHRHLEWRPREAGGGLVRDHGEDASILKTTKKGGPKGNDNVTPQGTHIVESGTYFGFRVDPETGIYERGIIGMSSTQLTVAKQWNYAMTNSYITSPKDPSKRILAALFFYCYRLTTVLRQKNNNEWYVWNFAQSLRTMDLPNGTEIYMAAREFRKMILEGQVQLGAPAQDPEGDSPF